jgi:predicted nucleic acid-binding protein
MLGVVGGFFYQEQLWHYQQSSRLLLLDLTSAEISRMHALMQQYRDRPMDLADASLVAVAESRKFKLLFTLDSDFRFYRLRDGSVLDTLP